MFKKVAIPTQDGILCDHFGHCQQFYFAEIEGGKIVNEQFLTPPEHQPGVYPAWINEQGADVVIAAGIGGKAKDLFVKEEICIYDGGTLREPTKLVEALLSDSLKLHVGSCKHKGED